MCTCTPCYSCTIINSAPSTVAHAAGARTQILDESLATGRLRERRRAREERREAAKRLAALRPEQRAAVRSEDERLSRRIAVMEQVLGVDNAGRFHEGMVQGGGAGQGAARAEGGAPLPSLEAQRATLLERRVRPACSVWHATSSSAWRLAREPAACPSRLKSQCWTPGDASFQRLLRACF